MIKRNSNGGFHILNKIVKRIRIKHLKYYQILGRNKYMKRLKKVYSKYGVQFLDDGPRFIASDVYFESSF